MDWRILGSILATHQDGLAQGPRLRVLPVLRLAGKACKRQRDLRILEHQVTKAKREEPHAGITAGS